MDFKEWKQWLANLPWVFRWFPLLVLVRPLVDNFYYLKEISPFLSPLYIVGVLTPVLCIWGIIKYTSPQTTNFDRIFFVWGALLALSCLWLYFGDPLSFLNLEFVIKITLPLYLFLFLRRMIRSVRDLEGILMSFWLSTIPVAVLIVYEVFVNPLNIQESRGLERIQGNFGDVVSYGIYITGGFLVASYFFLKHNFTSKKGVYTVLLILTGAIGVLGLLNIHHTASYVVFISLTLLLLFFQFRFNMKVAVLGITIVGILVFFLGESSFEEKIAPLIETDMKVYSGELETERLMHGRMGRWKNMWEIFSSQHFHIQFFGYPLTLEYAYHFIGGGAHNDFIRLLFLTGYIGLITYLLLIHQIWVSTFSVSLYHRFLVLGILGALLLFSISTTPTLYAPFLYISLSVYAFLSLSKKKGSYG